MPRNRRQRYRWVMAPALIVALYFMFRLFEHSQVYHPSRTLDATGAELGRRFEDVVFRASDGTELNGWFYAADGGSRRGETAILFCHGNAGNISDRLNTVEAMLATGTAVFVFDYRGYGRSAGRPSEEGTYLDAEAAYDWLRGKGFDQIVVFGESLGGGVASELVLRRPAAGLILQSTFTSIPDIGADLFPWLPVRWLARIRYDTVTKLSRVRVPVLVMHSRTDGMIPFRHAERNFIAAPEPKLLWELRGDHNNPLTDRRLFIEGLEKLLAMTGRAGS